MGAVANTAFADTVVRAQRSIRDVITTLAMAYKTAIACAAADAPSHEPRAGAGDHPAVLYTAIHIITFAGLLPGVLPLD